MYEFIKESFERLIDQTDQIHTIDKSRFVEYLGTIDKKTGLEILKVLQEMFQ